MDLKTVVFFLANYFIQQRYTRNVIFLNCMDTNGKVIQILVEFCWKDH